MRPCHATQTAVAILIVVTLLYVLSLVRLTVEGGACL